jgi:alpha-1,2-mannosyltransferase
LALADRPLPRFRRPSGLLVVGWVVVSLAWAVIIWRLYRLNSGWIYDTYVYRMGGSIVLHGSDLYARTTPHPYTYTPFSALLFIPLAWMPVDVMAVVWTTLSLAGFILTTWIVLGWLGLADDRFRLALTAVVCLVFVWLDPVADTLLGGQINLIVMGLVVADLVLPDNSRWKGIGLGFAASFKLLPLFFVVYLLLTRRMAAAVRAVATFAATIVLGFLFLPKDSLTFWSGTFVDSSRVGAAQNPRSESLLSLLVRWTHQAASAVEPIWLLLGVVVAVVTLVLAVWAHRRGDELLAVCVAAAGTLYLSPITWRHHWVWIVPMLLWLIREATRRAWLWLPIGLITLDFYLRPYGSIAVDPVTDLHLSLGQLLVSSTHPVSVAIFLASAFVIRRSSRPAPDSSGSIPQRRRWRPALRPASS